MSASDTKCRELEAAVKGKEQELVLREQEMSGQVAALQDKLEKREAHLMRRYGLSSCARAHPVPACLPVSAHRSQLCNKTCSDYRGSGSEGIIRKLMADVDELKNK